MKNLNKWPSYTEKGYKQGKGGEDAMNHFDFTGTDLCESWFDHL
ncbi:hypothetical protein [Rossellomorea marisflavi]|nr:hypothetical protein [Rossellomorea marisflavi]